MGMAKYNYDKSVLSGLKTGPFINEVKVREEAIAQAPETPINSIFNANKVANSLHPDFQMLKIAEIKDFGVSKEYKLVANNEYGTFKLAYFRAGQFLSLVVDAPERLVYRTYHIVSSPKESLGVNGFYKIEVNNIPGRYAPTIINNKWKVGDLVVASAPLGNTTYYESLRDSKTVIMLGVPVMSYAKSIVDGTEDYNLIVLGCHIAPNLITYKEELDNLVANSNGKVSAMYFVLNGAHDDFQEGIPDSKFLKQLIAGIYKKTGEIPTIITDIPPYLGGLGNEVTALNLPKKYIREIPMGPCFDVYMNGDYPEEAKEKEYKITVLAHGEEYSVNCKSNETMIDACSKLKLHVTTECRSGICGWCRSRLVSGNVYVPNDKDGRRMADIKFGWIHPCVTYPLSDCTIEVYPNY